MLDQNKSIIFSWIKALTGLRALAVLSVVLGHDPVISTYLFGSLKIHAGGIGVAVFFVLSGFLAYFVLRRDEINYSAVSYSHYLYRRILRIWPAYFFVIFGTLIYLYLTGLGNQTTFFPAIDPLLTFTSNFHTGFYTNNTVRYLVPLWTIAVEEHFYLCAPVFYKAIRSRWLLPFIFLILLFSNGLRLYFLDYFDSYSGSGGVYFLTFSYLDMFISGMLLAHFYIEDKLPEPNKLTQEVIFIVGIALTVFAGILWGNSTIPPYTWYSFSPYLLLTVSGSVIIYSLLPYNRTFTVRILESRPLQVVGILSFSIYLTHQFVIQQVGYLPLNPWQMPERLVGLFFWIFGLSAFIYLIVERPFLLLKKYRPKEFRFSWPVAVAFGLISVGFVNFIIELNINSKSSAGEIELSLKDKYYISKTEKFAFLDTSQKTSIDCSTFENPIVVVSLGQSNLGNYNEKLNKFSTNKALNFNAFDGKCYQIKDPLLGNSGTGGSASTLIAEKLIKILDGRPVVIVSLAMGASRVRDWSRRGQYYSLIKLAVSNMYKAGLSPSIFIWQQGESEVGYQDINGHQYAKELEDIILNIRKYYDKAPFLVSQSTKCFDINQPRQESVRKGIELIVNQADLFAFKGPNFDLLNDETRIEGCHFNDIGTEIQTDLWSKAIIHHLI